MGRRTVIYCMGMRSVKPFLPGIHCTGSHPFIAVCGALASYLSDAANERPCVGCTCSLHFLAVGAGCLSDSWLHLVSIPSRCAPHVLPAHTCAMRVRRMCSQVVLDIPEHLLLTLDRIFESEFVGEELQVQDLKLASESCPVASAAV